MLTVRVYYGKAWLSNGMSKKIKFIIPSKNGKTLGIIDETSEASPMECKI